MKNSRIKNIIFDLGDVILNIDVPLASSSFGKLSGREQHEILTLFKEKELSACSRQDLWTRTRLEI